MKWNTIKTMKKILCAAAALVLLAGCGSGQKTTEPEPAETEKIELLVWCDSGDTAVFQERAETFKQEHSGTEYEIIIQAERLNTAADTVLADPDAAADVFAYPESDAERLFLAGAIPYREDGIYGYPLKDKDGILLGLNPASAHFEDAEELAKKLAAWGE